MNRKPDANTTREPASGGDETRVRATPEDETSLRGRVPGPLDDTALRTPQALDERVREDPTRVPPRSTFGPGYKLRGRYLLDEPIGQGAMGQVWRAKDLLSEEARDRNPYVAVKVLNSDFERHPDAFFALHREATRAQKLAHPNIVTVYVFDRDDLSGRAFIAMELLEGRPLDRVIREAGPQGLPRAQSLPIIRGMAEGLAYAHRKGIVHSDFKPANVFLTTEGTPKILDFGIARVVQALDAAGASRFAPDPDDSGFQGYTPSYAAPEALAGESANTAEDVFSLGVVSYELASGVHPFKRLSALQAIEARIKPAALRGLKRRECNTIEKALAFERRERFADAAAFLRQLQGVPAVQKALAAAVALLVVAAGGLSYRNYRESLPAEPLEQLPAQVQTEFRDKVRLGNESLAYLARTHDITASADAAEYFADAYKLHEKDPQAVNGLEAAADQAIAWYRKLADQREARAELEKFRAKSDYYQHYAPLERAIHAAGGD